MRAGYAEESMKQHDLISYLNINSLRNKIADVREATLFFYKNNFIRTRTSNLAKS